MSFAVVCHIWTKVSCQKLLYVICCCLPHKDNCFMSKMLVFHLLLFATYGNCFMSKMIVCHLLLFVTYGQMFHVKNDCMSFAVVCHIWTTVSCQKCLCFICCCLPSMVTVSCRNCLYVICCCLSHMDKCFMSKMIVCHLLLFATYG